MKSWLVKRHLKLMEVFKSSEFSREDATKLLKGTFKDNQNTVDVVLSELRKEKLLVVTQAEEDKRRRKYRLVELEKTHKKITRSELEALLKRAADIIRTRVDYKFILILLFLKRISDKWEEEFERIYKEALEAGLSEEEARKEAESWEYEFKIPKEYLWDEIRKDVNTLPEKLAQAFKAIGELNPDLKDVVDKAEFIRFAESSENRELLRQLVELFSEKKLRDVSPDVLGDAYEWILRYFAPQKAKEGEIYTPREVIRLLVEILDPNPTKGKQSVYDPACGSGGMLIESYRYVRQKYGKSAAKKLFLFGQEANHDIVALGKMNMFIHDIRDVQLEYGDTLDHPKFIEGDEVKQFSIVIANIPWNQDGYDESRLKRADLWQKRFPLGFTSKQSADWAWIQHMLASTKDDGVAGVIVDNGALFRGNKERNIREKVIEKDWLECVILLPEKLFYNTGAPGAIMVFNKNKSDDRKGKVLFINASQEFEKHPEVRKLNRLSEANIKTIVETYRNFKEEEGFSKVVTKEKLAENDFNLNVTLYAHPKEEWEEIDVGKEWEELEEIKRNLGQIEGVLMNYIKWWLHD